MRRRTVLTSLLCLGLAFAVCGAGTVAQNAKPAAPSPPAPQYRITGTLVSSADGSPVPHGHLVASLSGTGRRAGRRFPSDQNSFDADDQGRFTITLPSAGLWNVAASARGFTRQSYQEHEQFSTGVMLTRAMPAANIRFLLSPEAQIAGVVTDEAGEAVRGAMVLLMMVRASTPDDAEPATAVRSAQQTDDRGMYEFDGLAPGSYRLCVQARPWYAELAARVPRNPDEAPSPDPSLDMAYPVTWFPGSSDPNAAETVTLRGGDVREADFHLSPVPSIHLLITAPPDTTEGGVRRMPFVSGVQRVDGGADSMTFMQPTPRQSVQGQIDVGGLVPGTYRVTLAMPNGEGKTSVVRVAAGAAQTFDFGTPEDEAQITVHVDGLPVDEANTVQISLLDAESRHIVAQLGGESRGGFVRRRGLPVTDADKKQAAKDAQDAKERERTVNVPPGQYEVVIQGRPDLYLTGITAKGAQGTGRVVTVAAGASSLTLHVAEGRATLTGIASIGGKPVAGTMVMLAPATLGETGAIQIVRRDQSNTDGSFNLADVIPGQYILIAIEDGWAINWKDAATLQRYLTGGVAVDLRAGSETKQDIVAQQP